MGEAELQPRGYENWRADKPAAPELSSKNPEAQSPIIARFEQMPPEAQAAALKLLEYDDLRFESAMQQLARSPDTVIFLRTFRRNSGEIKKWEQQERERNISEGLEIVTAAGILKDETDGEKENNADSINQEKEKLLRLGFIEATGSENFFYTELNNRSHTWLSGSTAARDKFTGVPTSYPNATQAEQLLQDSIMQLKPGHSVGAYLIGAPGKFILLTRTEAGYNKGVTTSDQTLRPQYVHDGVIADIKTFAVAMTPEQRQVRSSARAAVA